MALVPTYTVALDFEVTTTDYDPDRLARMAARFASYLPDGSQTLRVNAAVDHVASLAASVPGSGVAHALRSVATALELAANEEPAGIDSLGEVRRAVVELAQR